jgi:hypothetical protein
MTLSTTTNRAAFEGTGTTGPFSFTFPFQDDAEITVFTVLNGVITDLDDSEYTLTGEGDTDGGSVTTVNVIPSGTTLIVMRVLELDQTTDLVNNGPFYAETHEDTFDRLAMQIQQLQEQINRCLRMPKDISTDQTLLIGRSGTYPYFDDDGNLTYVPSISFSTANMTTAVITSVCVIPPDLSDILLINGADSDCLVIPQTGDTICNLASYTFSVLNESARFVKITTNWVKIN